MKTFLILAAGILLASCQSGTPSAGGSTGGTFRDSAQSIDTAVESPLFEEGEPYTYGPIDTFELSGGYRVIASLVPDTSGGVPLEVFELWEDTLVAELVGWGRDFLRYDAWDLGDYFISFERSTGPMNPQMISLIVKRNGMALIEGNTYIDLSPSRRYLLYGIGYGIRREDPKTMVLFDVGSMKAEFFDFPSDLIEIESSYNIGIKTITPVRFVIEYTTDSGEVKQRSYRRG